MMGCMSPPAWPVVLLSFVAFATLCVFLYFPLLFSFHFGRARRNTVFLHPHSSNQRFDRCRCVATCCFGFGFGFVLFRQNKTTALCSTAQAIASPPSSSPSPSPSPAKRSKPTPASDQVCVCVGVRFCNVLYRVSSRMAILSNAFGLDVRGESVVFQYTTDRSRDSDAWRRVPSLCITGVRAGFGQ